MIQRKMFKFSFALSCNRIHLYILLNKYNGSSVSMEIGSNPLQIRVHKCFSPLCKMVYYSYITQAYPPMYFKLSLDYL